MMREASTFLGFQVEISTSAVGHESRTQGEDLL